MVHGNIRNRILQTEFTVNLKIDEVMLPLELT
jgi:hypothetical protein